MYHFCSVISKKNPISLIVCWVFIGDVFGFSSSHPCCNDVEVPEVVNCANWRQSTHRVAIVTNATLQESEG